MFDRAIAHRNSEGLWLHVQDLNKIKICEIDDWVFMHTHAALNGLSGFKNIAHEVGRKSGGHREGIGGEGLRMGLVKAYHIHV